MAPIIIEPASPWWTGSGSPAVAANVLTEMTNGSGNSRIPIFNSTGVAQKYRLHAHSMFTATTANWTPIYFVVQGLVGATVTEVFQSRVYSNTAAGGDWSSVSLPPRIITVAAGTTKTLIPYVQFVSFAGTYNRDNNYHGFHVERVE